MTTCVPVRDMKDTAAFSELVQKEGDVTVTKNGYDALHCLSNEEYKLLQDEVARAKLLSRMMLAESEIEGGQHEPYDAFASALRQEYGL